MSRPDRLNELKNKHILSFEKDFGADLQKAKEELCNITSENEGPMQRKTFLKE
jgi:hypothetical protein